MDQPTSPITGDPSIIRPGDEHYRELFQKCRADTVLWRGSTWARIRDNDHFIFVRQPDSGINNQQYSIGR